MNKAVFFDRDDTIIKNIPYNGNPALVKLMPHAREGLALLQQSGFLLFIISNQSGVGRGYISSSDVNVVNAEMNRQLEADFFSGIYCCFDDPDDPKHYCRKPSPKLILQAANEHNIDVNQSFFVGDKMSDIQAGINAGCRTVFMMTDNNGTEQRSASRLADFTAINLLQAAEWIISHTQKS